MKYTTEQLELIAIMFKIQHGDKTIGDIFPCCRNEHLKGINIGELTICKSKIGLEMRDFVSFLYNGKLILWFSCYKQILCPVTGICSTFEANIPIDDIIKMLSFEDKI